MPASAKVAGSYYANATGTVDAVAAPPIAPRPAASIRPTVMQMRPEYAMVALAAQRPGQLKKLFESLGGNAATLDVDATVAALQSELTTGGTLAGFGVKRDLDPTTLYLLAVQSRIAQRSGKGRVSYSLEHDMDALLSEHEAEIGAALNTSQAMRTLSGSASDRMWMRSLYVAAITVRSPVLETFESLLERFGTAGFEQGAATLLRALSDDIASNRSSVAPDRLQGLLLASLVAMRHVVGLIHTSQGFLRQQGLAPVKPARRKDADEDDDDRDKGSDGKQKAPGSPDEALASRAEALTVQLVRLLLQLTVTSNAARAVPSFLSQEVGSGMQSQELVRLRSQFLDLIRSLPPTLWKEATHKDHLMDTLRRMFDAEAAQRALPAPPAPPQNAARPQERRS